MRRLTSILLIAVTAIAVFNYLQLRQMREELAQIRAKVHIEKKTGADKQSQDGLDQLLAQVQAHSKKARTLMARGELKKARLELDRSLKRLQQATDVTSDLKGHAEGALGRAWDTVRYQAEKTWKDATVDRGKGK